MTLATFFIFGLIIGSFLNVVVYRIRIADTLMGRSYCPHCKKGIAWYDNIPVISFILLNFRCRYCKKKISWQYPLVEISTGILFALVALQFFSPTDPTTWIATFYYLVIVSMLLVIFVYDSLFMEIPGLVLWPAIAVAVGFNLLMDSLRADSLFSVWQSSSFSGLLAAFLAFFFFFLLVAVSREKWMGMGDAYLVILLGLITGWPQIVLGLFAAFLLGSIWGIAFMIGKKKTVKSQIPFAPFLVLGTLIAIFCYTPIIHWYFSLIAA